MVVAERLKRRWVGIDISPTAVRLMGRRLDRAFKGVCKPTTHGLPVTVADLKTLKPFEFQNWVIGRVVGTPSPRKVGDMGIDGYWPMTHDPIQVKQSERIGRSVIDNFETAMRRAGKDKGYVVAFSFGSGAKAEVARARVNDHLDITLITAQDLIDLKTPKGPIWAQPAPVATLPLPEVLDEVESLSAPPKSTLPTFAELVEQQERRTKRVTT